MNEQVASALAGAAGCAGAADAGAARAGPRELLSAVRQRGRQRSGCRAARTAPSPANRRGAAAAASPSDAAIATSRCASPSSLMSETICIALACSARVATARCL